MTLQYKATTNALLYNGAGTYTGGTTNELMSSCCCHGCHDCDPELDFEYDVSMTTCLDCDAEIEDFSPVTVGFNAHDSIDSAKEAMLGVSSACVWRSESWNYYGAVYQVVLAWSDSIYVSEAGWVVWILGNYTTECISVPTAIPHSTVECTPTGSGGQEINLCIRGYTYVVS